MRALSTVSIAVALLIAAVVSVEAAKPVYKFELLDKSEPKPPRRSEAKKALDADGNAFIGSYYDYLVLAVQKCSDWSDWSMHGLWPTDWDDKSKPSYCTNVPFNKSEIEDLWPNITKYWETCSWSHTSETDFLSHEWQKHGTCFGTSEHTFFQTALDIFLAGEWRHECDKDKWSKSCQVKVYLPNSTTTA